MIRCALILFSVLALHAEIIPADRRITWSPGVQGGLFLNSTQTISQNFSVYTNLPNAVTSFQINTAITNASTIYSNTGVKQVIQLTYGDYYINSKVKMKSGVTLRGKGMQNTRLLANPNGYSDRDVIFFDSQYDFGWANNAAVNLVSPTKGTSSITSLAGHLLSPGDKVVIDMLTDTSGVPAFESKCAWCGRESGARVVGHWQKLRPLQPQRTSRWILRFTGVTTRPRR
jgi:hypothetical protein